MGAKILVVDDEPLICQLLTYQLGGAGYEVVTAADGQEALGWLITFQPALVILDVMMPGLSGWDLCSEIRRFSRIPIIMLTGKNADQDVVTGLSSGADDYIAKPFQLSQLLARVEAVLRRSPAREQPSPVPTGISVLPQIMPELVAPVPAFATAVALAESPGVALAEPPVIQPPRLGPRMSHLRRMRGLTLHQAESATGVRWEFLQALEQEQFNFMTRPQLRHALFTYGSFLELNLDEYLGKKPQQSAESLELLWRRALPAVVIVVLILVLALSIRLIT